MTIDELRALKIKKKPKPERPGSSNPALANSARERGTQLVEVGYKTRNGKGWATRPHSGVGGIQQDYVAFRVHEFSELTNDEAFAS